VLVLDGPLDDDNGTLIATQLLALAAEDDASDIALWIHSPGGSVPAMLAIRDVLRLIPNEEDRKKIDRITDYDCSWGMPGVGRFRVNILRQRSSFMVVMRVIPFEVPTFDALSLPPVLARIARMTEALWLRSIDEARERAKVSMAGTAPSDRDKRAREGKVTELTAAPAESRARCSQLEAHPPTTLADRPHPPQARGPRLRSTYPRPARLIRANRPRPWTV